MDAIPEIVTAPDQPMTQDEKQFFRQLGSRVAALRKEQGLTQVQLAQALELTQQMIASYEIGRRRIPVSLLPQLARALGTSVEELIGDEGTSARKRGPAPKLQQQIERIQQLPKTQQKFVMQMLDTVLAQAAR
jgi:transcriptional regulator with XRE-family HTH domain